ncbi:MAG: KUP/HAK/KT family potassium transporter [Acidimicrobiales bacterium]
MHYPARNLVDTSDRDRIAGADFWRALAYLQAVQLDYLPRLTIRHTSPDHIGQVFVPLVNWLLMVGCVGLVLTFRTSSALAAAYGIAVTTTMLITTLIFYRVVRDKWYWSTGRALATLFPVHRRRRRFLSANIPKIPAGGFTLAVGTALAVQMTTWRKPRTRCRPHHAR